MKPTFHSPRFCQKSPFKRTSLIILAGLSFSMVTTLGSCKKEAEHSAAVAANTDPKNPLQSMARTYSTSEATELVEQAKAFQQYANELRSNGTPVQGNLASEFFPKDALKMLENTTNYFYGRPNEFRPKDSTVVFTSSSLTSATTTINLKDLAVQYNEFRNRFKGFYEGINSEKSFGFTNFEYDEPTKTLVAVAHIRYGAEDPSLLAWQSLAVNQTFPVGSTYSIVYSATTTVNPNCPNQPDPMIPLSSYVKQNIGLYNTPTTNTGGMIPIATDIEGVNMNTDQPETQTSNYNFLAQDYPDLKNYNRLFSIPMPYNTPIPDLFVCIYYVDMDYYRSEQRQMVLDMQTAKGKKCITYKLSVRQKPNGRQAVRAWDYEHQLTSRNFEFANIVYVSVPTSMPSF